MSMNAQSRYKALKPSDLTVVHHISTFLRQKSALELWKTFSNSAFESETWIMKHNSLQAGRICEWINQDPTPWLEHADSFANAFLRQPIYKEKLSKLYWTNPKIQQHVNGMVAQAIQSPRLRPDAVLDELKPEILNAALQSVLEKQLHTTDEQFLAWIQPRDVHHIYEFVRNNPDSSFALRWHQHPKSQTLYEWVIASEVKTFCKHEARYGSFSILTCTPYLSKERAFMVGLAEALTSAHGYRNVLLHIPDKSVYHYGRRVPYELSNGERAVNLQLQEAYAWIHQAYTKEQRKEIQWLFSWMAISTDKKQPWTCKTCSETEQLLHVTHMYHLKLEKHISFEMLSPRVKAIVDLGFIPHQIPPKLDIESILNLGRQYERLLDKSNTIEELTIDSFETDSFSVSSTISI